EGIASSGQLPAGRSIRLHGHARFETSGIPGLRFDRDEHTVRVHQSPIGFAVAVLVERHGLQGSGFVGFPLVDLAVAIRVLLGAGKLVILVMLPSVNLLLISDRGDLDTLRLAIRTNNGPRISLAIVATGKPNLGELTAVVVVLPTIDPTVLVP